jgi:predicted RNA binding protein YcfA (HicA-like mRNA interferase family)
MARATAGIKNREWHRILRRQGFYMVRHSGGHSIYRHPAGGQFPTVGEGRPVSPSFTEIKCAAQILNVSIEKLLGS